MKKSTRLFEREIVPWNGPDNGWDRACAALGSTKRRSTRDILVTGHNVSLETEASTGSRLGLTLLQTPASVSVVDGDDIRARCDMSVLETVTRAPGITSNGDPDNGGTALAARGFSGQGSVLQLVDGIRLFPAAGTITFPTDPFNIDRIEVLNGPAPFCMGRVLGGAVNVITKKPNPDRTEIEAETGYGSQDSAHVVAGRSPLTCDSPGMAIKSAPGPGCAMSGTAFRTMRTTSACQAIPSSTRA